MTKKVTKAHLEKLNRLCGKCEALQNELAERYQNSRLDDAMADAKNALIRALDEAERAA